MKEVSPVAMQGSHIHTSRWRYLGRIAVLGMSLIFAFSLYSGAVGNSWIQAIASLTARLASSGLGLLGISASVSGTILASESFVANIATECTVIGHIIVFIAAILVTPSILIAKAWGVLLGIAVLTTVNFIRIISLFWIGSSHPQYLDIAHTLVWQTAMTLLAIILWLFWIERIARARHS
jgi:exosortase/archaeosortase family protein